LTFYKSQLPLLLLTVNKRMAKEPRKLFDYADDTEPQWPVIDSYTTEDGLLVKVYKPAYAVVTNLLSARPSSVHI
jgi:hypothetical protein